MWILGVSETATDWIVRWVAPLANTVAMFLAAVAGLLQEFFWWFAAQVNHLAAGAINLVADKVPTYAFDVGKVVTWWTWGNHWLPLNECLLMFSIWLSVVASYFLTKVILKLF